MKGRRKNHIRRISLSGLFAVAVLIFVAAGWGSDQWRAEGETASLQSASGSPVLYKNNLPAVLTQDLPPASPDNAELQVQQPSVASTPPSLSIDHNHSQAVSEAVVKTALKTVYLTFDDGPSKITPTVLKILHEQGVKATFFVLGEQARSHPELINAIWEQGHAIGNHTYNHNYHELYSGFTEFWSQIKQTEEIIRSITGVRPQLVRAPGGTFGHFDETYFRLLEQGGYSVMDWTADSGDSRRKGVPAAEILKESVADLSASRVILLLHDGGGHDQSAKALPEIIKRYKAAGYVFGVLDGEVQPVQFRVSANAAGAGHEQPSQAWIAENIVPNRELFLPGKALALEVGLLETKLLPGEYSISTGQYKVPLRAAVERLGGQVSWDAASRSGRVVWNGRTVVADAARKQLTVTEADGSRQIRSADVQIIGSSLWVPLRGLLEAVGHPPLSASVNAEERRVTAL